MKEYVEPREWYIGNYNTLLIALLPQEVDNEIYFVDTQYIVIDRNTE
jgi:hypothetical protein